MKTTLVLDDHLVLRLKAEAARQRRTLSDLVQAAIRQMLDAPEVAPPLPDLPTFHGGPAEVDLADRDALYRRMDGR